MHGCQSPRVNCPLAESAGSWACVTPALRHTLHQCCTFATQHSTSREVPPSRRTATTHRLHCPRRRVRPGFSLPLRTRAGTPCSSFRASTWQRAQRVAHRAYIQTLAAIPRRQCARSGADTRMARRVRNARQSSELDTLMTPSAPSSLRAPRTSLVRGARTHQPSPKHAPCALPRTYALMPSTTPFSPGCSPAHPLYVTDTPRARRIESCG